MKKITYGSMVYKFVASTLAALVLCFAVSGAGHSADSEKNWKIYLNARFGYAVEYPDIFSKSEEPDNGDGITFESKDGEYTLAIWGGHNISEENGASLLKGCYERVAHIVPDSEKSGDGYYSIEYSDDGGRDGVEHIFHEYGVVNPDAKAGYVLSYPKDEGKRFAEITSRMDASLKLPEAGQSGGVQPIDISAYRLKNGRVYRGNTELDCAVFDVPAEIEGSVRYYSAFGAGASDAVPGAETGVWFFSDSGGALTFVPLESENECQGVVFSPDGGRFVLVRGSGMRPDMFFDVYGEGTEKLAELSGLRGAIQWIDPVRFVFSRIDEGIREGGSFLNLSNGLRLSVVMYDAAAKEEIVLKGATDTRNYSLGEVIEDGNAVTVIEESVKSPKDWGDEEKTQTREIRVEIPAAG